MRPRERRETGEQDLFRSRLDQIIDINHPLARLARTVDSRFLEGRFGEVYTDDPGHAPPSYRPKPCWISAAFSRTALFARPMKIGIATINSKPITKRVRLTRRLGRLIKWTFERSWFFSFSIASTRVSLEPSPRVGVRNSLHQLANFRFQKLICHYQRPHRFARVAGRDGLIGCRLKLVRVGLEIWHGVLRHGRFRVD